MIGVVVIPAVFLDFHVFRTAFRTVHGEFDNTFKTFF